MEGGGPTRKLSSRKPLQYQFVTLRKDWPVPLLSKGPVLPGMGRNRQVCPQCAHKTAARDGKPRMSHRLHGCSVLVAPPSTPASVLALAPQSPTDLENTERDGLDPRRDERGRWRLRPGLGPQLTAVRAPLSPALPALGTSLNPQHPSIPREA